MECIERDPDRQEQVEVRRLISDACAAQQPLEVREQEVSVLEETEHAEIRREARDQPAAPRTGGGRARDARPQIKIQRRRAEEQQGKGRIPSPVENVARDEEEILSSLPRP